MGALESCWRISMAVLRAVFVTVNNLYCIPTYVVWCSLFFPVYIFSPDVYWYYEGILFDWLLTMVAFWSYSAGYRIVETGDIIEGLRDDETLVLVNHQSTSDVPLLMHCFGSRRELLERLNWVMDAVFQYTNFGIVSTLHGDFFINAGKNNRDASLKNLEKYLRTKWLPRKRKWLVLFPEGGFLRKRKDASKRYAQRQNLPDLDYVTLPRLGAIQTIINTLGEANKSKVGASGDSCGSGRLKYIIDMTIAYPNGVPLDLGAVITGYQEPCNIRMHYKIYPLNEVPYENPDDLQTWLYNLYIEKNNVLGHYYRTGVWNPETRKIDINGPLQKLEPRDSDLVNANVPVSSDVVDEARNVQSRLVDDDLLRHRVPTIDNIHNKINDTELIAEQKGTIKQSSGDEQESNVEEKQEYNSKTIHLDLLRVVILHGVFILSTLVHVAMGLNIYSLLTNL